MLLSSGKSSRYWWKHSVSAPALCCPRVDRINKARDPCFSRVVILQSWIANTGMNFLDTACIFQSNIWMHVPERFSSLLTVLGLGEPQPAWWGLKWLQRSWVGFLITIFFYLHRYLEHCSFVVLGCCHSFLPDTSLSCLERCRVSLLDTPWALDRHLGCSSGPTTNRFFKGPGHRSPYSRADSYPGNHETSKQSHRLLPLIKDTTLLLIQLQDTLK